MGDSLGTVAGGAVTGTPLPGCDVSVSLDTNEMEIVERPSPQNNFRQVKIRNKSSGAVSNFELHWSVK
jgi:hypothetical protein